MEVPRSYASQAKFIDGNKALKCIQWRDRGGSRIP